MWVSPKHPDHARLAGTQAPSTPPEPTGEVLAAFKRSIATGPTQELRVSLDEFEGNPYISIRLWEKGKGGAWWPTKKGVTVRMGEASGVAEALLRATELVPHPAERRAPTKAGGRKAERAAVVKAKVNQVSALRQRASLPAELVPVASPGSPTWKPDPQTAGVEWM